MAKAGRPLNLMYDGEKVGEVNAITFDGEDITDLLLSDVDSDGWEECIELCIEWTMEVEVITDISWDETWLVAYQARMYAEYFKN